MSRTFICSLLLSEYSDSALAAVDNLDSDDLPDQALAPSSTPITDFLRVLRWHDLAGDLNLLRQSHSLETAKTWLSQIDDFLIQLNERAAELTLDQIYPVGAAVEVFPVDKPEGEWAGGFQIQGVSREEFWANELLAPGEGDCFDPSPSELGVTYLLQVSTGASLGSEGVESEPEGSESNSLVVGGENGQNRCTTSLWREKFNSNRHKQSQERDVSDKYDGPRLRDFLRPKLPEGIISSTSDESENLTRRRRSSAKPSLDDKSPTEIPIRRDLQWVHNVADLREKERVFVFDKKNHRWYQDGVLSCATPATPLGEAVVFFDHSMFLGRQLKLFDENLMPNDDYRFRFQGRQDRSWARNMKKETAACPTLQDLIEYRVHKSTDPASCVEVVNSNWPLGLTLELMLIWTRFQIMAHFGSDLTKETQEEVINNADEAFKNRTRDYHVTGWSPAKDSDLRIKMKIFDFDYFIEKVRGPKKKNLRYYEVSYKDVEELVDRVLLWDESPEKNFDELMGRQGDKEKLVFSGRGGIRAPLDQSIKFVKPATVGTPPLPEPDSDAQLNDPIPDGGMVDESGPGDVDDTINKTEISESESDTPNKPGVSPGGPGAETAAPNDKPSKGSTTITKGPGPGGVNPPGPKQQKSKKGPSSSKNTKTTTKAAAKLKLKPGSDSGPNSDDSTTVTTGTSPAPSSSSNRSEFSGNDNPEDPDRAKNIIPPAGSSPGPGPGPPPGPPQPQPSKIAQEDSPAKNTTNTTRVSSFFSVCIFVSVCLLLALGLAAAGAVFMKRGFDEEEESAKRKGSSEGSKGVEDSDSSKDGSDSDGPSLGKEEDSKRKKRKIKKDALSLWGNEV